MNKELIDFINSFNYKDKLYDRVVKRHFKENSSNVIKELVDSGYFTETAAYKCPNCGIIVFNELQDNYFDYIEYNGGVCYNCDTDIVLSKFIKEPIWIRTDKPVEVLEDITPIIKIWQVEDVLEANTRGEREGTVITFQCQEPLKSVKNSIYVGYQKEDKWVVFKVTYRTKTSSTTLYKARFIGLRYHKHDPFDDDLKNIEFVNITDEDIVKQALDDACCN